MFKKAVFAAIAAAAGMAASQASAQNLVQNPGFEDGGAIWTAVNWNTNTIAVAPHTGTGEAHTGCVGPTALIDCTIGQTLATEAGQTYDLTFWLNNNVVGTDPEQEQIRVYWDGAAVQTINFNGLAWTQFSISNLVASTGSTLLAFGGRNDPATIFLDDVSVVSTSGGAVPEPASWALMIAGFGLVGTSLRRPGRRAASQ